MISLLIVIALIGVLTWALVTFLPMPGQFKTLIVVVAVIFCVLYALSAFGVFRVHDPPVPQLDVR